MKGKKSGFEFYLNLAVQALCSLWLTVYLPMPIVISVETTTVWLGLAIVIVNYGLFTSCHAALSTKRLLQFVWDWLPWLWVPRWGWRQVPGGPWLHLAWHLLCLCCKWRLHNHSHCHSLINWGTPIRLTRMPFSSEEKKWAPRLHRHKHSNSNKKKNICVIFSEYIIANFWSKCMLYCRNSHWYRFYSFFLKIV